jgi:hypothetical protein
MDLRKKEGILQETKGHHFACALVGVVEFLHAIG